MACNCTKTESAVKTPKTQCLLCAEKHFATARKAHSEHPYEAVNRIDVIGELRLAENHVYKDYPTLARYLRNLRHMIQYRRETETESRWIGIIHELDLLIAQELQLDEYGFNAEERAQMYSDLMRKTIAHDGAPNKHYTGNIYLLSNVTYPSKNALKPDPQDILVFLNKAATYNYYLAHKRKIVIHRSPKRDYGDPQRCRNIYLFSDDNPNVETIDPNIRKTIQNEYNYDYDPQGKVKCPTTGYYAALWLRAKFPNAQIKLVNFGYSVKKSTYRYPAHNWKWEDSQLQSFEHVSTEGD